MSYTMKTNKQQPTNYIVYRHSIGNEWWLFSFHFSILVRLFMAFVLNLIFVPSASLKMKWKFVRSLIIIIIDASKKCNKICIISKNFLSSSFHKSSEFYSFVTISIWIGTSIYLLFWFRSLHLCMHTRCVQM